MKFPEHSRTLLVLWLWNSVNSPSKPEQRVMSICDGRAVGRGSVSSAEVESCLQVFLPPILISYLN